jgi:hypothetical protein
VEDVLKALESGKTLRLDGQSAGVYFVSDIQQFWEAVRAFEAQQAKYTIEVLE